MTTWLRAVRSVDRLPYLLAPADYIRLIYLPLYYTVHTYLSVYMTSWTELKKKIRNEALHISNQNYINKEEITPQANEKKTSPTSPKKTSSQRQQHDQQIPQSPQIPQRATPTHPPTRRLQPTARRIPPQRAPRRLVRSGPLARRPTHARRAQRGRRAAGPDAAGAGAAGPGATEAEYLALEESELRVGE